MKWFLIFIILVAIVFGFSKLISKDESTGSRMNIGGTVLSIEVADTDTERIKGLSGRAKLEDNEGLLFVFEKEGFYGIWMKDMNFPIDIAWLDKNKKIIHIEENVSPNTYPKIFYASEITAPVLNLFILETNANFFKKSKIKIGDLAEF